MHHSVENQGVIFVLYNRLAWVFSLLNRDFLQLSVKDFHRFFLCIY